MRLDELIQPSLHTIVSALWISRNASSKWWLHLTEEKEIWKVRAGEKHTMVRNVKDFFFCGFSSWFYLEFILLTKISYNWHHFVSVVDDDHEMRITHALCEKIIFSLLSMNQHLTIVHRNESYFSCYTQIYMLPLELNPDGSKMLKSYEVDGLIVSTWDIAGYWW